MTVGEMINAALGGLSCGAPYPGVAPDDSPGPYVVLATYFGDPQLTLNGELSLQDRRVQLDVYAATYLEADQLADEVRAALGAQSHLGSPALFTASNITKEFFGVDPDVKLYRVMVEFTLWFTQ